MKTYIVVGLGYGDEGKGSWVDHLVRKHGIKYVVRFNGGAQAAHHVMAPDGRLHSFAQFGSGTLVPGTFTCLSRFMLVEPEALLSEAEALAKKNVSDPLSQQIVSENAPVITPFNRLLNKISEVARGASRHGSCGYGIGATQHDVETLGNGALYVRDLRSLSVRRKLALLHERKVEQARRFLTAESVPLFEQLCGVNIYFYAQLYRDFYRRLRVVSEEEFRAIVKNNDTVFEGAQGVMLDQCYGTFPHCTRSNTTFENANQLLAEAQYIGSVDRVGLLRGYGTRHGAGPFVTEDANLSVPACHNRTNTWQGDFRHGWFDAVAARYALEVTGGVDTLAITNLDRMRDLQEIKVGVAYENADERYFSADRMRVLDCDYPTLADRTAKMEEIVPRYMTTPGFKDEGGMQLYLDTLGELLGSTIDAFSSTVGHKKGYRAASVASMV